MQRACVRHDECPALDLALQVVQRVADAVANAFERFTAGRRIRVRVRAGVDVADAQALPFPERKLAPACIRGKWARAGNDRSRFACAREIARDDFRERFIRKRRGDLGRLRAAFVIERNVGLALETPLRVPIRRSVADEDDL